MALFATGLLTFNGRAAGGSVGAKQKASGVNWSCGDMWLRTGLEWQVQFCMLVAD